MIEKLEKGGYMYIHMKIVMQHVALKQIVMFFSQIIHQYSLVLVFVL